MRMKKIVVIFVMFFIGSLYGIVAQTSSSDFYVNQQQSGFLDYYSTWEEFVSAMNILVELQQLNAVEIMGLSLRIKWVQEPTRMENELVNRAYRELPDTTGIGSAYLIQMFAYNGKMIYNIYIYSDPDGKRYYRLLRVK
jgi:hypothetical protein